MEECVVCLEDCNMDISELRIEDCQCKCKYKIHFDCLSEYLKKNNNKCLYCNEEIFQTTVINIPYQPDIDEQYALRTVLNNNTIIRQENDNHLSGIKAFCSIILALILLYIILSIIL